MTHGGKRENAGRTSLDEGVTPIVPVRMPSDEKQAAKDAAKLQELSLSEFIRAATKERVTKVNRKKS